jgi:hypothetical protein
MEDDLAHLQKVFGKVSHAEAHYEVYRRLKVYPKLNKLFTPKIPYPKRLPYMEPSLDALEEMTESGLPKKRTGMEEVYSQLRSLNHTKTLLRDYTLCNEFDLFATYTFSPKKSDRYNPEAVKRQMADWLHNQRNRNGRFKYLIVAEFHKDKKALHFHALLKDYKGGLIDTGRRNKRGQIIYHFKSYTLGFNSAIAIDGGIDRVASYVRKYITKDMPQFRDKRRFWTSHNLERPRVVENPTDISNLGTLVWEKQTDHGLIQYFERPEGGKEVQGL